ncbi:phage portal protein [Mesorhizobium sp. M2A.F.Ca.ET.043.02.1.1]|uniref:phage portal protein n=1 Tax=Mesorhizobium sp. M2A.F.Ca.ET.043.02.1.1 TaxID=2493670 RepID=UPI000F750BB1|nr:phage portal protein [Mesorhizobium sp. M2A.F.Ca.ET.043.02.1.1]AZO04576.1 phage portal protein [Mesorhizobium sp. M2A.F.Ca.ET.043.02.1.1]TIU57936.1 MAG: phage portal protein [Mesorhizobium sp.]
MKLFRKMADVVVRALSVRQPDGWYPAGQIGDAGEPVTGSNALALSAVWGCVNLLAGTISSLPLMVYRTLADGTREVAKDHPLYRLLHDSPNFDQTAVDFWDFMASSIELWGNAYARQLRGSTALAALVPVRPDLVSVRRLTNGTLEYRWSYEGRAYVETDQTMLHIRGPGGDPLGGMSTLHFGRHAFSLARATDKAAGKTFANGLRPSGGLKFANWLNKDQRDIARSEIADKIGADNAGKPIILEGGTEWVQFQLKPEDAQMLESRAFSVEEICRFFGVPPVMIGHTSKTTSWPTGVEQQGLILQKFTLRRRLKRIEQALEKQLLTPKDRADGISIEFNLEGLLRADSAGRSAFYKDMTSIGAMTINEVRMRENMPKVEGGDVPRMQMQNIPITADPADQQNLIGGPK